MHSNPIYRHGRRLRIRKPKNENENNSDNENEEVRSVGNNRGGLWANETGYFAGPYRKTPPTFANI